MGRDIDPAEVTSAVFVSISLLRQRLCRVPTEGGLSLAERSALARLDRCGPSTPGALARREQITPQGMGVVLAALEERGLVTRSPDPDDGRRVVVTITANGICALADRQNAQVAKLTDAVTSEFSDDELRQLLDAAPLLERLVQGI